MKICPYCEGELSDTARKCKFCGEWVTKKEVEISSLDDKNEYLSDEEFNKCIEKGFEGTNQLKYITDAQAKILAQYKGYELSLNGLEIITDNQAKILSKYQGSCISLDGLENISEKQLKYLSEFNPEKHNPIFKLSLNGLKHITDKQAEILSNFNGSEIILNGLNNITDKQIEYFDQFLEKNRYNCNIKLGGLKSITDKQAKVFSTIEQEVDLNNLTSITDKQAEILSNFKGTVLSLNGLKKITNTQIIHLSKIEGQILNYKINNNTIEVVKDYDYEETRLDLVDYIEDNQLKIFVENYYGLSITAKNITDAQAKIFSNVNFIRIHGLAKLTDEQVEIFTKFKGNYLELWVDKYSEGQKKKLVDTLGDKIDFQGLICIDKNKLNIGKDQKDIIKGSLEITTIESEFDDFNNLLSEKEYIEGTNDWKYREYYKNGNLKLEEKYINGLKEGESIKYKENGNIKEIQHFNKGEKVSGIRFEYHGTGYSESDKIKSQSEYEVNGNRILTKSYIEYYENGTVKINEKYKDGELNGDYYSYYETGALKEKGYYSLGNLEGEYIKYYENGNTEETGNYINGYLQGEYFKYYENGKIKEKGYYENGKLEGNVVKYDENGNIKGKQKYKRGKESNIRLWIGFIVFSIIAGFIIPSETATERFFVISSIIAIHEIYKEYKEKKRLEIMQIFLGIFGTIIGTFILSLTTYIISSLALTCIYKIGIINPETYSKIYCNKVAGSLEKHHCSIKGNVSFDTGEKIYHKPGCENYNNTVINEAYGELYFPDEETAQKAGFRKCKDDVIYDWAPGMYDY